MLTLARRAGLLAAARRPLSPGVGLLPRLIASTFFRAESSEAGDAVAERKLNEKEERRLDLDKKPRTRREYIDRYGTEHGVQKWDAAAGRRFVELRFDSDGEAYSKEEFLDYFGDGGSDRDGIAYAHWDASRHFAHQMTIELKNKQSIGSLLDLYLKYDRG